MADFTTIGLTAVITTFLNQLANGVAWYLKRKLTLEPESEAVEVYERLARLHTLAQDTHFSRDVEALRKWIVQKIPETSTQNELIDQLRNLEEQLWVERIDAMDYLRELAFKPIRDPTLQPAFRDMYDLWFVATCKIAREECPEIQMPSNLQREYDALAESPELGEHARKHDFKGTPYEGTIDALLSIVFGDKGSDA